MKVSLGFNYLEPHRHIAELKLQHQANSKEAEKRKRHGRKNKTRGHQQNISITSPYCPHDNNERLQRNRSSSVAEHQALMQNNPPPTLFPYLQHGQSQYALPQRHLDANILPSGQEFLLDYPYLPPNTSQQDPLSHYGHSTVQLIPYPLQPIENQVNRRFLNSSNLQGHEPEPLIQSNQEHIMTSSTHPIDGFYPVPYSYNSPLVSSSHGIPDFYGQIAQSMNSPAAYHGLTTSLSVTSSPMPMPILGNPDRQADVMPYQYA